MTTQTDGADGLAGRYASALYELADSTGVVPQVADDLKRFVGLLNESEDLRRLVRSPVIGRREQSAALDAIVGKMNVHDLTRRFFGVVTHNRRLFAVEQIIAAFRAIEASRRGEIEAEVVAARPLDDRQIQALTAALRQATGAQVVLATKVDSGAIGGLVVRVGSRLIDSTLRTKLQKMRRVMKGVG